MQVRLLGGSIVGGGSVAGGGVAVVSSGKGAESLREVFEREGFHLAEKIQEYRRIFEDLRFVKDSEKEIEGIFEDVRERKEINALKKIRTGCREVLGRDYLEYVGKDELVKRIKKWCTTDYRLYDSVSGEIGNDRILSGSVSYQDKPRWSKEFELYTEWSKRDDRSFEGLISYCDELGNVLDRESGEIRESYNLFCIDKRGLQGGTQD